MLCLAFAPAFMLRLQAWAQMEMELGRMEVAKQILEVALQVDPDHMPSHTVSYLAATVTLFSSCGLGRR